ncbi:MAG: hypothetical protein JWR68_3325 [Polaromonas sp.]|nr:hypothetical protein [Polaromonas sp.]
MNMHKLLIPLAALVVSFAASAAPPSVVQFESGSAQVKSAPQVQHKKPRAKKVWVPGHRAQGRWVKGRYAWR